MPAAGGKIEVNNKINKIKEWEKKLPSIAGPGQNQLLIINYYKMDLFQKLILDQNQVSGPQFCLGYLGPLAKFRNRMIFF